MSVVCSPLDPANQAQRLHEMSLDLDLLLRGFEYKACLDPRDKVYGILGLVDKQISDKIPVNYSLSTVDVYTGAMSAMLLGGSGDLRYLTGTGFNSQRHQLPSWVRDFGCCPDIETWSHELKRLYSYSIYNAAGAIRATPVINRSSLRLSGTFIDRVQRIGNAITSRRWSEIGGVVQKSRYLVGFTDADTPTAISFSHPIEGAFWHSLVRGSICYSEKEWRRIMVEDVDSLKQWLGAMQEAFITGYDPPMSHWLRTMVYSMHNRRIFSTDRLNIGNCGLNVKPGDEVWILCGGKVPFILRPYAADRLGQIKYILIGEAYLHGFMDGEAFESGSSPIRIVELQ